MKRLSTLPFLLVALAVSTGCVSAPANLDLTTQHASKRGAFIVALEPPPTPAAINVLHSWHVKVTDAHGTPVHRAHIGVDGGMPQHGHGFPTQPRVTGEVGDGVYLLEGMKFSMTGWWDIKLSIDADGVHDDAIFNTMVGASPATR